MSNIKKRLNAERRFKFYGQLGVFLSLLFVTLLMLKIFTTGSGAFFRTTIEADVFFDPTIMKVDKNSSDKEIERASFESLADSVVNNNFKKSNSIILFLGKSGREHLLKCRGIWNFEYKEKKSLTNPESKIIKIYNLKRK